jgi:hypothetical protein
MENIVEEFPFMLGHGASDGFLPLMISAARKIAADRDAYWLGWDTHADHSKHPMIIVQWKVA